MTSESARYKSLPLDLDASGLDEIAVGCVQDCIVFAFKKLQERCIGNPTQPIALGEPSAGQFIESIDLLLSHKLKNKKNSFWNLAKEISFNDAINSVSKSASSEEKARAWLHQAIQDQLLHCYLSQLSNDRKLLDKFYRKGAAAFDQDLMFSISNLLLGLESIKFDLTSDNDARSKQRSSKNRKLDDFSESIVGSVRMHIPSLLSTRDIKQSNSSLHSGDSFDDSMYSNDDESVHSAGKEGNSKQRQKSKRRYKRDKSGFDTTAYSASSASSKKGDKGGVSMQRSVKQDEKPDEAASGLFSDATVASGDLLNLMARKLKDVSQDQRGVVKVLERNSTLRSDGTGSAVLPLSTSSTALSSISASTAGKVRETEKSIELKTSENVFRGSTLTENWERKSSFEAANQSRGSEENVRVIQIELPLESSTEESGEAARSSEQSADEKTKSSGFKSSGEGPVSRMGVETEGRIKLDGVPSIQLQDEANENGFATISVQNGSLEQPVDGISKMFVSSLFFDSDDVNENGAEKENYQFNQTAEMSFVKVEKRPKMSLSSWLTSSNDNEHPMMGSNVEFSQVNEVNPNEACYFNGNEVDESIDEALLLGTAPKKENLFATPFSMAASPSESKLEQALSPTLYLEQNPHLNVHPSDLHMDHRKRLNFDYRIYQFNQDNGEEPINLFRGFYRHMELPSSWTKNSYHARVIDLLITNRAVYLLKFDEEKNHCLHYFFPLDEILLITTYPFDQGLKIFSRRSHEVDWTRLNANESKRNAEFWFETGDPQLTQIIADKLSQAITQFAETRDIRSAESSRQPTSFHFGGEPIIELAQLKNFMAFTFNYEQKTTKEEVKLFSLVFMGESPPLETNEEDESEASKLGFYSLSESQRSSHSTGGEGRSETVTSSVSCISDDTSARLSRPSAVAIDGILFLKEEASAVSAMGGIISKRSGLLPSKNNVFWKDYQFTIKNGNLYKAEYSNGGKVSQPEFMLSLSDCLACKLYKDSEKLNTFLLTTSKSAIGFSRILAARVKAAPILTYCFAARNERDASEWIHTIRKFIPSSGHRKQKGRPIPVKATALVMDSSNAAVCRYEREREEFYAVEKFRLSDIWRVITADSSVFAGNNSDASRDFVVLDFRRSCNSAESSLQGDVADEFEIVDNTNLVDNQLPMLLFFCSEDQCTHFLSLLQSLSSATPLLQTCSEANLTPYVIQCLVRTQTEIRRTRMLHKV